MWRRELLQWLVCLALQIALSCGQRRTLVYCDSPPPQSTPEANLINNLMVDCSQFTLSWTNNLELSAFDRIDYYGLEASCTNSSEYIKVDEQQQPDSQSRSFNVIIPPSARPSPGQNCTYFGCVLDSFEDIFYFHAVTCTDSITLSAPTQSTVSESPITAIILATTTTTNIPISQHPVPSGTTVDTAPVVVATMESSFHRKTPTSPSVGLPMSSILPGTEQRDQPSAPNGSTGTREALINTTGVSILVVLTPLLVTAFTLALLLSSSLAVCHYCATKHRKTDYRKRPLPEVEAQGDHDLEDIYLDYLPSPLSRSSTMAYSQSEASIHTLLEHLWVYKSPLDEGTSGNRTTNFHLLDISSPKHHPGDLRSFDSFVESDGAEYIVGMSKSTTTSVCPDISADQVQPKCEELSDHADTRVTSLESELGGAEHISTAVTSVESELEGDDHISTTVIRLESEHVSANHATSSDIRLGPELELEDSGYYFQAEYSVVGDNSTGHTGRPEDKLKHKVATSHCDTWTDVFQRANWKSDSGFCSNKYKTAPPIMKPETSDDTG